MISDQERIICMNKAVHELMQTAESDIRKGLPNFNAATLTGAALIGFTRIRPARNPCWQA